ncbi:ZF-HD homeobox protein [Platanthera zijinensis]|uniref:ZF-HD homeobox protein n=1 Tax=Platanthera zijinensis TaxID=2320716 RepID=A0AAP0B998_9ASPA
MDFDDHDEAEEEVGLSNYDPRLGNSGAGGEKPTVNTSFTTGAAVSDPGGGSTTRKPSSIFRYRECLKNHAVSIGGHAVDGCGEFLPAGDEGSLDALRCAACSCHRNFHRKEVEGGGEPSSAAVPSASAAAAGFHSPFSPYYRTPAGYLHQHHQYAAAAAAAAAHQHHRPVAPLALPSTSGGGHSREELDDVSNPMGFVFGSSAAGPSSSSGKKRFRTKFTQEQKDKMLGFAEAVGWRIQKHDEAAVQQFCNETSVKRHVLKVWMHNNKHTLGGKKP